MRRVFPAIYRVSPPPVAGGRGVRGRSGKVERPRAARAPWTEVGLFWVGLFASLHAALPLVGVPSEWIPPVSLYVTRATFAKTIERLEPVEPVARISSQELRAWGRVVVFTAIAAPSGLSEPIYHAWQKNGHIVGEMLLTTIRGGRPGGFRTYSWKTDLGADPTGLWQVDVRTVRGQVVGRVRLAMTVP